MNLAEYRRELASAHNEYMEGLQTVADRLQKRLAVAHMEFLGDEEKNIPVNEDIIMRRRERDEY